VSLDKLDGHGERGICGIGWGTIEMGKNEENVRLLSRPVFNLGLFLITVWYSRAIDHAADVQGSSNRNANAYAFAFNFYSDFVHSRGRKLIGGRG